MSNNKPNPAFKPRETDLLTGVHHPNVNKQTPDAMERSTPLGDEDDDSNLNELQRMETLAAEPGDDGTFLTRVRNLPEWIYPKQLLQVKDAFVVPIDAKGPKHALRELDKQLREKTSVRLVSHKQPRAIGRVRVTESTVATYTHGAQTKIVLDPGLYRGNAGHLRTVSRFLLFVEINFDSQSLCSGLTDSLMSMTILCAWGL